MTLAILIDRMSFMGCHYRWWNVSLLNALLVRASDANFVTAITSVNVKKGLWLRLLLVVLYMQAGSYSLVISRGFRGEAFGLSE